MQKSALAKREKDTDEASLSMLDSPLFSRLGAATPFHVLDNIGRYTKFVGLAKLGLLFAALGLVLMVSAIMILNDNAKDKVQVVFSQIKQGAAERPIMLSPRFEGLDANDQPYSITAAQAAQTKVKDETYVQMQSINADLTLKNGGWLNLRSLEGVLITSRKLLHIEGDVSLYDDQGYEMHTPDAWVELEAGRARGEGGITIAGPAGTLKADHFIFDQKAQTAHFNGNVEVRLYEKTTGKAGDVSRAEEKADNGQ